MSSGRDVEFDLPRLCEEIRVRALDLSASEPDPALTVARLMDGVRDAGVATATATEWKEWTKGLDRESWMRLELLVCVFRETPTGALVAARLKADKSRLLHEAFPLFCDRDAKLLTLELLLKSAFRVEELARKWVHALHGGIAGETAKKSDEMLERLDFGGVLKNLRDADADRAVRMKKAKELEAKRLKAEQEAYARAGRE